MLTEIKDRQEFKALMAAGRKDFSRCDLTGVDLHGLELNGFNFTLSVLKDCDLNFCDLSNAKFCGAVLTRATIKSSGLEGADFTSAILKGVNVSYTNLSVAITTKAIFDHKIISNKPAVGKTNGTVFSREQAAAIEQARQQAPILTKINNRAEFEAFVAAGRKDFSKCDLSGVSLSRLDLSKFNFSFSILRDCNLNYCDLSKTQFRGTDLTGATIRSSGLKGADFTNAILASIDVSYTNLSVALTANAIFDHKIISNKPSVGKTNGTIFSEEQIQAIGKAKAKASSTVFFKPASITTTSTNRNEHQATTDIKIEFKN